jgi:hypothetical protein
MSIEGFSFEFVDKSNIFLQWESDLILTSPIKLEFRQRQKPYMCDVGSCTKSYKQKYRLEIHKRTHVFFV